MNEREAFVALDVAKLKNAVAVAESCESRRQTGQRNRSDILTVAE